MCLWWKGRKKQKRQQFSFHDQIAPFDLLLNELNMSVLEHINYYMQAGLDKKKAMKKVAQDRGVSKREIYAETIKN